MAFILFCLYRSNGKFWLGSMYTVEFHLLIHTFKRLRVKMLIVKISKEVEKIWQEAANENVHETQQ